MSHITLDTYSKDALTEALRTLRNYKNAYNQIGKRAQFSASQDAQESLFRVQHTPSTKAQDLDAFVQAYREEFFPQAKNAKIQYEINPDLTGGIRVFYHDDMVDVSFSKYRHLISF